MRDWALNQGYYNLFLAVGTVVGVLLASAADPATVGAGIGMVLLATGIDAGRRGGAAGDQTRAIARSGDPGRAAAAGNRVSFAAVNLGKPAESTAAGRHVALQPADKPRRTCPPRAVFYAVSD